MTIHHTTVLGYNCFVYPDHQAGRMEEHQGVIISIWGSGPLDQCVADYGYCVAGYRSVRLGMEEEPAHREWTHGRENARSLTHYVVYLFSEAEVRAAQRDLHLKLSQLMQTELKRRARRAAASAYRYPHAGGAGTSVPQQKCRECGGYGRQYHAAGSTGDTGSGTYWCWKCGGTGLA